MLKTFDDMQKTTSANVDATMRSFEGATKTTQAIAGEIADYTRRSFEHGAKSMEKPLGAKSPDKAFEIQTKYAKAAYESYVSHANGIRQGTLSALLLLPGDTDSGRLTRVRSEEEPMPIAAVEGANLRRN